jgi:hypothetical protein
MKKINLIDYIEKEFNNLHLIVIKKSNKGIIAFYRKENYFLIQITFKKTYKVTIEFFRDDIEFIKEILKNEFNFDKILLDY